MIRIAFGSKARTGKDTSANYVCKRFGVTKQSFGTSVYDIMHLIQDYFGKEHVKDPELLQLLGDGLRNTSTYTEDVWVDRVMDKIGNNPATLADLRYPNEYAKLKAAGFITVRTRRSNRVIDRDVNHPSEVSLDHQQFDEVITNDYSKLALYARINYILMANNQCKFTDYVMLVIEADGEIQSYVIDAITFTCAGVNLDTHPSSQTLISRFREEFDMIRKFEDHYKIISIVNKIENEADY